MKIKNVFFVLLAILIQSCAINSEFTFHADNTISAAFEVEMKTDSLQSKPSNKKMPENWTSIYDLRTEEGNAVPADSVELAKRMFVKGVFREGKEVGFGFRFDKITDDDWKKMKSSEKQEEQMLSSVKNSSLDWNGKDLILNVEEIFKNDAQGKKSKKGKDENDFGEQMLSSMKNAFDIGVNLVFKFDNKIKKITGKHPNFKQIDAHRVEFRFNMKEAFEGKKKYDKKITITTE